jgi:hypothetical protein
MAAKSAEMPEIFTETTDPAPDATPPHSHNGYRDMVRIALSICIPIYARLYLFSSLLVAFVHIYVIGSTGVCIVHFSGGTISVRSVWDVIYGLLISSFPSWGTTILRISWVGPSIQGWRWEVVYWVFVARRLIYLLPEHCGNDVEVRRYAIHL